MGYTAGTGYLLVALLPTQRTACMQAAGACKLTHARTWQLYPSIDNILPLGKARAGLAEFYVHLGRSLPHDMRDQQSATVGQ